MGVFVLFSKTTFPDFNTLRGEQIILPVLLLSPPCPIEKFLAAKTVLIIT